MGTDLSAMVIGFADNLEAKLAANGAFLKLTGLEVDASHRFKEPLRTAEKILSEKDRAISSLYLTMDELNSRIAVHSLCRWKPEEPGTYERFVEELRELFPDQSIVLMSDYDLMWVDDKRFSDEELLTSPRFVHPA